MKTRGGVVLSPPFLTSALEEGKRRVYVPAALSPRKNGPRTHWIRAWVSPRAGMDKVEKGKISCPNGESNPDESVV